jgi:hypothetical protein
MFNGGPFYSWTYKDEKGNNIGWFKSIEYLVNYMNETGPYDGLLGFS